MYHQGCNTNSQNVNRSPAGHCYRLIDEDSGVQKGSSGLEDMSPANSERLPSPVFSPPLHSNQGLCRHRSPHSLATQSPVQPKQGKYGLNNDLRGALNLMYCAQHNSCRPGLRDLSSLNLPTHTAITINISLCCNCVLFCGCREKDLTRELNCLLLLTLSLNF